MPVRSNRRFTPSSQPPPPRFVGPVARHNRPVPALIGLAAVLICVLAAGSLRAAPATGDVEPVIREMIRSANLGDTRVAVCAVDLTDRIARPVVSIGCDDAMIPASNAKLLTTAAALDILGPDFRFQTGLRLLPPSLAQADGIGPEPPRGPRLLIVADGDPAFGDPVLLGEEGLTLDALLGLWVDAIADTGYQRFEALLIDDRVFDDQFVHPAWPRDQLNRHYCAQVAGFNVYLNCLDLIPEPSRFEGGTPALHLFPRADFVPIINRGTTGRRDLFSIRRDEGTNRLTFRGQIRNPVSQPVKVTLHDPPLFFLQLLSERLGERGIAVEAYRRLGDQESPPPGQLIQKVVTALGPVLNRTNQDSKNLFAEALLKRMGHRLTGAPGSWSNGAAAARQALAQRLGPRASILRIDDGSGMSRRNAVTARMLVDLLTSVYRDPDRRRTAMFLRSLARSGTSGTLENRMGNLPAGWLVLGKTGYLREVSTVSGYLVGPAPPAAPSAAAGPETAGADVDPPSPPVLAFSILVNDFKAPVALHQVKDLQERILEALAEAVRERTELVVAE